MLDMSASPRVWGGFPEGALRALVNIHEVAPETPWRTACAQRDLPELPVARRARYVGLGLPPADAVVLADEPPTAAYFDAVLEAGAPAKPAANWVMGDIMAFCKARPPPVLA